MNSRNHMKMPKSFIFAKKNLEMIREIFRDDCHYRGGYRGVAHSTCNLNYSVPKNIYIAVHNGSNYDYHFIINKLAKEFEKQFTCLGENTEKHKTFCTMLLMSGFMLILLAENWFEGPLFDLIIIIA